MLNIDHCDGVSILRLHAPPLNTLTIEILDQLCAAVRQANADPGVCGLVIAGSDEQFSAGADVHLFQAIDSATAAGRLCQLFQEAFQVLEDSPKPIAAALAGSVLGGALELALACHYRVARVDASFRLPEVTLGINPGAGGTQRLPRLIGPKRALRMLLTAESVSAQTAREWGLVDELAEPDQVVAQACQLLRDRGVPRRSGQLAEQIGDPEELEAAWQLAQSMLAKTRPELIAPRKIVEAVRLGATHSMTAGLAFERQAFADCLASPAAQNKLHLFFATRSCGKIPELAAVPAGTVQLAAVVGMGTMGTGIVQALVQAGIAVVALDQDPAALQRGLDRIQDSLQKRVGQGRLAADRATAMLRSVTATTQLEALAGVDLVIESVFEDLLVKRVVLAEVQQVCSPDAVLATNTSAISLDDLAEGLESPERLIGMHFFNPAQRMPLLEIVRRSGTPPAVLATALGVARRLRKTPVIVANRTGFLVDRLFVPYLQEAFWLLEEGASAEAIDRVAVEFGFPMGPLALVDMAGLEILVHSQCLLQQAFPHHGRLSPIACRLLERGARGQKSGAGVYSYRPDDFTPYPSPETDEVVGAVQLAAGRTPRSIDDAEITERLVLRMVNEAFHALDEGIARRASDVDVAMVLGTGFPDYRGGVLKYASDLGHERVLERLEELKDRFGERFAPCRGSLPKKGYA